MVVCYIRFFSFSSLPLSPDVLYGALYKICFLSCISVASQQPLCGVLTRTFFEPPSNHLRITSEQNRSFLLVSHAPVLFGFRCKSTAILQHRTEKTQQRKGGKVMSPYLPRSYENFFSLIRALCDYCCTLFTSSNAALKSLIKSSLNTAIVPVLRYWLISLLILPLSL